MMMKQLIQKAKTMIFEPIEVGEVTAVRRIASHLEVDHSGQPFIGNKMTPEQRIRLLELQNQQLRMDANMWKNTSLRFAHELRELLVD